MILNTNIASLNTQRNLQGTNNAMQKSLENYLRATGLTGRQMMPQVWLFRKP
jgi:flagellin-like hook-associated protein FlgL